MKKINFILVFVVVLFFCSACSLNLSINTDGNTKNTEESKQVTESTEIVGNKNIVDDAPVKEEPKAFYGVWCYGGKSESDAENFASQLSAKGFESNVFVTTDWENLNSKKFYVVTAGVCETKQEAEQLLGRVKLSGYQDAYIKYTGERK